MIPDIWKWHYDYSLGVGAYLIVYDYCSQSPLQHYRVKIYTS